MEKEVEEGKGVVLELEEVGFARTQIVFGVAVQLWRGRQWNESVGPQRVIDIFFPPLRSKLEFFQVAKTGNFSPENPRPEQKLNPHSQVYK